MATYEERRATYGERNIFWRHRNLNSYGPRCDIEDIEKEKLLVLEEKILEELRTGHDFGVDFCLACPKSTKEGVDANLYFYKMDYNGNGDADLCFLFEKRYSEKYGIFGERAYPKTID